MAAPQSAAVDAVELNADLVGGARVAADDDALAALIERSAEGDRAAFRALYDATAPRLLAAARRILGRADLAEEAVQDAYVTIWEHAARYRREEGAPLAWMSVIARRRAIDRLRASPWLKREAPEPPVDRPDAATPPAASAEAMTLKACLEELDETARNAILAAYLYGLTHSELSRRLDRPLGTVKSLIRRGVISLKRCLGA